MANTSLIPAERIGQSLMESGNWFYPEAISKAAAQTDTLFYFILYASIIVTIGLIITTFFLIRNARIREKENNLGPTPTHNTKLEVMWTVIPTLIVLLIFFWGFRDYMNLRVIPGDPIEIKVTAQKWQWGFDYGWGKTYPHVLVVPENRPIKLVMTSTDVIHSFYLPNLRLKRDIMPNRYTVIAFNAEKKGSYQVFCTEYCGLEHWKMLARMDVVSQDEYDEWVTTEKALVSNQNPVQHGEALYKANCAGCHSVDGTQMSGPTWKSLFGGTQEFSDGSQMVVDENYLVESIQYPQKKIVKGYKNVVMPSYIHLTNDEIDHIIQYIKTIK